jgi:RNA recognition motif-containing protein
MPKRIFIGSLPLTTSDSTINTAFSPYGTLVTAAIDRDVTGGSLGTAHAEYTTDQAGTDAIAAMHLSMLDGNTITVTG